jgi:hypothetical protein
VAFFFALLAFSLAPKPVAAQPANMSGYEVFYNDLAPYGQWLNDPQYGYVWVPDAGPNFRPYYTNGYWAMTEYGNMWMSNYSWGWAPFHYGRWVLSQFYGWIWIPGNEWGPAWVTWRQGNGYYGWAPMGPGVSINISFGPNYYLPDPYWTFIPSRYIYSHSFHRYYAPRRTGNIIHHTTIINNTYVDRSTHNTYVAGPRRSEVQKATGRVVPVYDVRPRNTAGNSRVNGKAVNVYRPRIENSRNGQHAAPRNAKSITHPITAPSRATNNSPARTREPAREMERTNPQKVPSRNVNPPTTPQRAPRSIPQQQHVQKPTHNKRPARTVQPRRSVHPQPSRPARAPQREESHTAPPSRVQPSRENHGRPAPARSGQRPSASPRR